MGIDKPKLFRRAATALAITLIGTSVLLAEEIAPDLKITVKPGDNLIDIVERVSGATDKWQEVARYNDMVDPHALSPGQVITVPGALLRHRSYAVVDYFSGQATYFEIGGQAGKPLERGQRVYIGESVKTEDGFISLSFTSESVVNIQPQSDFRIDEIECADTAGSCQITLWSEQGDATVKVNSNGFERPTNFTIKTPYASAVVRGTVFDFTVSKTDGIVGNTLGVAEGEVLISSSEAEKSVPGGKGVVGGEGQSVSRLYDLLQPPVITNLPHYMRVSPEDRIEWLELPGAASYELSFGSGGEPLARTSSSLNYSAIEFPAGDYTVGVRGVDENGLRGYPATQRVVAVDLAPELSPLDLSIGLSLDMLRVEKRRIDPRQQFEIQISDRIETHEGQIVLADYQSYDLGNGEAFNIPVDNSRDIYLRYRQLVDETLVSRYTPVVLIAASRDR